MNSEKMKALLAEMDSIDGIRSNLFKNLVILDPEEVNSNITYSDYSSANSLDRAPALITEIPEDDLVSLAEISPEETEARKVLDLLSQAKEKIVSAENNNRSLLSTYKILRDARNTELERRTRKRIINEGGCLLTDEFTSRFILGPPPPPYSCKMSQEPIERDWLFAFVKSGKKVAVQHLGFSIDIVYLELLKPQVNKIKGYESWGHYSYQQSLPFYASRALARIYYENGFLPRLTTTIYYSVLPGWHKNFRFHTQREIGTKDLKPAE